MSYELYPLSDSRLYSYQYCTEKDIRGGETILIADYQGDKTIKAIFSCQIFDGSGVIRNEGDQITISDTGKQIFISVLENSPTISAKSGINLLVVAE
jgi:hypothetical protein